MRNCTSAIFVIEAIGFVFRCRTCSRLMLFGRRSMCGFTLRLNGRCFGLRLSGNCLAPRLNGCSMLMYWLRSAGFLTRQSVNRCLASPPLSSFGCCFLCSLWKTMVETWALMISRLESHWQNLSYSKALNFYSPKYWFQPVYFSSS